MPVFGSGTDKSKDDVKRENDMICNEYECSQTEYKRFRAVIDQLGREYEQSKDFDMFRRYGLLKGMIKRTILHMKMNDERSTEVGGAMIDSEVKKREELRRRSEKLLSLTTTEIDQANENLNEQVKEHRRKVSMIRDLIEQLDRHYEDSKRYVFIQRYRLMKSMVKTITHNQWI